MFPTSKNVNRDISAYIGRREHTEIFKEDIMLESYPTLAQFSAAIRQTSSMGRLIPSMLKDVKCSSESRRMKERNNGIAGTTR